MKHTDIFLKERGIQRPNGLYGQLASGSDYCSRKDIFKTVSLKGAELHHHELHHRMILSKIEE